MRLLPYGDRAVLAEVEEPHLRHALVDHLDRERPDGVTEVVPGAGTVMLQVRDSTDLDAVREHLDSLSLDDLARRTDEHSGDPVTIDVVYDGPDLDDVARHLGVDVAEVVRRHTSTTWTCEFVGFLPGFAYLSGTDQLEVPRLDSPRNKVPAGSVGLAGTWSGVYPSASPGGWRLIGRTSRGLFDPTSDSPALVPPGATVRFVEADS